MTDTADNIIKGITEAVYQIYNHGLNRSRPYNGQPHTSEGERGKTIVSGLTYRDIADCFVKGWLVAAGHSGILESPDCTYNDIYKFGGECDVDPLAVKQNMSCEMEKLMGIYPNVPKLEENADD